MKFFIIGLVLGIGCTLFFTDEIAEYEINKYIKSKVRERNAKKQVEQARRIIEQERKKNEQF